MTRFLEIRSINVTTYGGKLYEDNGSTFISQLFFSTLNIGVASGMTKVFDMQVIASLGKCLN